MHFILYSVCISLVVGSSLRLSAAALHEVHRKRKLDVPLGDNNKLPKYLHGSNGSLEEIIAEKDTPEQNLDLPDPEQSSDTRDTYLEELSTLPFIPRAPPVDHWVEHPDSRFVGHFKDGNEEWLNNSRPAKDWQLTAENKKRDRNEFDNEFSGEKIYTKNRGDSDNSAGEWPHKDRFVKRPFRDLEELDEGFLPQAGESTKVSRKVTTEFDDVDDFIKESFEPSLETKPSSERYESVPFPLSSFKWTATDDNFRVECLSDDNSFTKYGADIVCHVSWLIGTFVRRSRSLMTMYLVSDQDDWVLVPPLEPDVEVSERAQRFVRALDTLQVRVEIAYGNNISIQRVLKKAWYSSTVVVPRMTRTVSEVFGNADVFEMRSEFRNVGNHPKLPTDTQSEFTDGSRIPVTRIGIRVPTNPNDAIVLYPLDGKSIKSGTVTYLLNQIGIMTILVSHLDPNADYERALGKYIASRLSGADLVDYYPGFNIY